MKAETTRRPCRPSGGRRLMFAEIVVEPAIVPLELTMALAEDANACPVEILSPVHGIGRLAIR